MSLRRNTGDETFLEGFDRLETVELELLKKNPGHRPLLRSFGQLEALEMGIF